MRTIQLKEATGNLLDNVEELTNQLQSLTSNSEPERRFKGFLKEIADSIASHLFLFQDLVNDCNEISDSEMVCMLQEYEQIIN